MQNHREKCEGFSRALKTIRTTILSSSPTLGMIGRYHFPILVRKSFPYLSAKKRGEKVQMSKITIKNVKGHGGHWKRFGQPFFHHFLP